MNKFTQVVAAGFTAMLGFSASANTVDLFTDPSPVPTVLNQLTVGSTFNEYNGSATAPRTILGGYRDINLEILQDDRTNKVALTQVVVGNGQFSIDTPNQVFSRTTVQWDGADNSAGVNFNPLTNLGGENLKTQEGCPVGGCTQFVANVIFADNFFSYRIAIYTDANNYTYLDTFAPPTPTNNPIAATYEFEWFSRANGTYNDALVPFTITQFGTGGNVENVGALELTLNVLGGSASGGQASLDLTLGGITKQGVPEPGSLALIGLGLLAAAKARRRKVVEA